MICSEACTAATPEDAWAFDARVIDGENRSILEPKGRRRRRKGRAGFPCPGRVLTHVHQAATLCKNVFMTGRIFLPAVARTASADCRAKQLQASGPQQPRTTSCTSGALCKFHESLRPDPSVPPRRPASSPSSMHCDVPRPSIIT